MLQSLAQMAEREQLLEDTSFEQREVHWMVYFGPGGRYLRLVSLLELPETTGGKKRGAPRGRQMLIPRQSGRTANDWAEFLVDKHEYVFGLPDGDEPKLVSRAVRRHPMFVDRIGDASTASGDEALAALAALMHSHDQFGTLIIDAGEAIASRDPSSTMKSNHLVAFSYEPDRSQPVHLRSAVRQYWSQQQAQKQASSESIRCVITGRLGASADKFPVVKGIPPLARTKGGVHLTAVDGDSGAFASYGWSGNENVPISVEGGQAYTTALNRLLSAQWVDPTDPARSLPEQRVRLSDDTIAVFWADGPSTLAALIGPAVDQAEPDALAILGWELSSDDSDDGSWGDVAPATETPSVEPLVSAYKSVLAGHAPSLDDTSPFRVLVLTGGQGRATVRAFHSNTVGETVRAVRAWFDDLQIGSTRRPMPLWRLMAALAVRGDKDKGLPANVATEVFLDILAGRPLSPGILDAALRRCRFEPNSKEMGGKTVTNLKVTPDRAAIIKACLNRMRRANPNRYLYREVTPMLDTTNANQGYLLGRMFACVERMQDLALGDVNASVTDRFFSSACATPQAVFPRLLKNEVHHFAKATDGERPGAARRVHALIGEIAGLLVGPANNFEPNESVTTFMKRSGGRIGGFPAFLPMEEQGLFVLGYHQQRNDFFQRRAAAVESDAATPV